MSDQYRDDKPFLLKAVESLLMSVIVVVVLVVVIVGEGWNLIKSYFGREP